MDQLKHKTWQILAPESITTELAEVAARRYEATLCSTPLELIDPLSDEKIQGAIHEKSCEMMIWSDHLAAQIIFESLNDQESWEKLKNTPHFAVQNNVAQLLETHGLPAITVPKSDKAIDLIELLLRLNQTGFAVVPGSVHHMNEISGLLYELGIDYDFWQIYSVDAPQGKALESLREKTRQENPDVIVFHNDEVARRYHIAFPEINLAEKELICTSEKIKKEVDPDGHLNTTVVEAVSLHQLTDKLL